MQAKSPENQSLQSTLAHEFKTVKASVGAFGSLNYLHSMKCQFDVQIQLFTSTDRKELMSE